MTKGDKINLRAELAGKAMAAMIGSEHIMKKSDEMLASNPDATRGQWVANQSVGFADYLLAELGISMEDEK